ncbi:hypothetical protein OV450_1328 [Actinobacteria bacterium OV450]|nr:hypothetical protein OV450_1328 [Actinobacteria bacterium OV450]
MHWHAYGRTSPVAARDEDEAERARGGAAVDCWLAGPAASEVLATYEDPRAAAAWMSKEMAAHPPFDKGWFGFERARGYTSGHLTGRPDMPAVAHYLDVQRRWVLRVLAPCPSEAACPLERV